MVHAIRHQQISCNSKHMQCWLSGQTLNLVIFRYFYSLRRSPSERRKVRCQGLPLSILVQSPILGTQIFYLPIFLFIKEVYLRYHYSLSNFAPLGTEKCAAKACHGLPQISVFIKHLSPEPQSRYTNFFIFRYFCSLRRSPPPSAEKCAAKACH